MTRAEFTAGRFWRGTQGHSNGRMPRLIRADVELSPFLPQARLLQAACDILASRRATSLAMVRDPRKSTKARATDSTGITIMACCSPIARKVSVILVAPAAAIALRASRSLRLPVSKGLNDAPHKYIAMK